LAWRNLISHCSRQSPVEQECHTVELALKERTTFKCHDPNDRIVIFHDNKITVGKLTVSKGVIVQHNKHHWTNKSTVSEMLSYKYLVEERE
jgi:hypothetical protein